MTLSISMSAKFSAIPGAVLLDLDNTLYPYDPSHAAAMAQVRAKASKLLSISATDFDLLYDKARHDLKQRVGRVAASHSRLLYFQRLLELGGFKTQALIALDLEQTYWRSFLMRAHLFEDALEFLDDLRLLGVPVVIVTDLTAQIQFRKVVHFGIDRYIDYIVTSEESGADKPAKASFELALDKIGQVQGPLWIIGDDPAAEIAGAADVTNSVSIQKLHDGVKRSDPPADASFERFADLRKLLGKIN